MHKLTMTANTVVSWLSVYYFLMPDCRMPSLISVLSLAFCAPIRLETSLHTG